MKLKSQKYQNASLDKALRPQVCLSQFRKKKSPHRSAHGYLGSSSSSFSDQLSSKYSTWPHHQQMTFSYDHIHSSLHSPSITSSIAHQTHVESTIKSYVRHSGRETSEKAEEVICFYGSQNSKIGVCVSNGSIYLK